MWPSQPERDDIPPDKHMQHRSHVVEQTIKKSGPLSLLKVLRPREVIEAPMGTAVLFKAWLPHLTRASAEGPSPAPQDWRMHHHTAYWRFGTEYFKQTLSNSLSPTLRVLCVGGWRGAAASTSTVVA